MSLLLSWYWVASCAEIFFISLRACSSVTPSARRPYVMKGRCCRGPRNTGDRCDIGIQTSLWNGHLNPSGMTPTIVAGIVLTRTALPMMDRSEAYRDFQIPPLINATAGAL